MAFIFPLLATVASRLLPVLLPIAARGIASTLPKILRPSMIGSASKVLNYIGSNASTIGSSIATGITTGKDLYDKFKDKKSDIVTSSKNKPQLMTTDNKQIMSQIKTEGARRVSNILDNILNQNAPFTARDMQFMQTLEHMRNSRGITNSDINTVLLNAEQKNKTQFKNLHNIITYDDIVNP